MHDEIVRLDSLGLRFSVLGDGSFNLSDRYTYYIGSSSKGY